MKKYTAIFGLFILAGTIGWLIYSASKSSTYPIPIKDQGEIRSRLGEVWMRSAAELVKKSQDPEAGRLYSFLFQRMGLAGTDGVAFVQIMGSRQPSGLALFPLIPSDNEVSVLKSFYTSNWCARFDDRLRCIFVRNADSYSSDWRGLTLLHEGFHAWQMLVEKQDMQNPALKAEQEHAALSFGDRLLAKAFGAVYSDIVDKEAEAEYKALCQQNKQPGDVPQDWRVAYDPRLDQLFGPCLSDEERRLRLTQIYTHANFRLIEKYWPGDKKARQVEFIGNRMK